VGEDGPIDRLSAFEPPIFAVGIVGPSQAGKSTLASRILQNAPPNRSPRTQGLHCFVAALQTAPLNYLAMVDGPGDQFAMQFTVVECSQIAFVILDHNMFDSVAADPQRRIEHHNFNKQLRAFLAAKSRQLIWVHLLLNKRDLWEKAPHQNVLDLLKSETEEWTKSNLARRVTSAIHSNENPSDIACVLAEIRTFLGSHRPR